MPSHRASIWTAVLVTLLVCVVGAGVGMGYVLDGFRSEKESLQKQIDDLKKTESASTGVEEIDISDWQTYSGDDFSFKYPKNYFSNNKCFSSQTNKEDQLDSVYVVDEELDIEEVPCESEFNSSIFNISKATEDSTTLAAAIEEIKVEDNEDLVKTEITVGEEKAYKYVASAKSDLDQKYYTYIYVENDQKVYVISWENSDDEGTPKSEISEQILETLTFKSSN